MGVHGQIILRFAGALRAKPGKAKAKWSNWLNFCPFYSVGGADSPPQAAEAKRSSL
jgi:hypothetical protein